MGSSQTQRKKIKPSSTIEQKLLDYFKNTVKLDFNKIKNIDDLQKALRKIDYRKLTRYINQTGIDIFRRNYEGYKGIMNALLRGTQNKQRQKQLDLAFQSMVQDRKIMQPLMDRFNYNVSLIKNIPQDIIAKLQKAYGEGVSFRGTEVEEYVKERLGKRAKLIIRTESAKLNSALTEVRSLKLGLRAYIWSTSEDRRVRASHKMMDGVLVFWGTRLELDKMVGNAGNYPNCRCVPLSVFELDDIKFPIKVAEGNLSIISKKDKAQIVSGQIRTYTREQFIKQYGDRFQ